jgi:uncharacterized membrane protein YtjA (UPF0391 family)
MTKLNLTALVIVALAAVLGLVGGSAIPMLLPQALFTLALILVLLNVMNESDGKRG